MGIKPKKNQGGDFERVTFPIGPVVMTLEKIVARHFEGGFEAKEPVKLMLIWKDADGDEFTDFVSFPKGFGFNEKSAFWNRMAALIGKPQLTEDDLEGFDIELPHVDEDSDDPVAEFLSFLRDPETLKPKLNPENQKPWSIAIDGITFEGEKVVGKQCVLQMKPKTDKDGKVQEGNKVAADGAIPLNAMGTGKKKSGGQTQAPPPQAASSAAAAMP
ncbi:hypothetical protein [Deinococcus peraridilitoris]|uniref:Uncharacterized protein n=1 Tax=Deinococcus peraridilitoris (strain DSM 19664 / LMG 22246 / CIP 109416 / KR-200) TaxID=937777 RepID=K9ZY39_DEIPD|nr:hypothetical protein [Deinococcus peraridilitoris]AFZ66094.1 hypothetical protein Deipe_0498 [Deinococcus peraridilitoris DSM 19664]